MDQMDFSQIALSHKERGLLNQAERSGLPVGEQERPEVKMLDSFGFLEMAVDAAGAFRIAASERGKAYLAYSGKSAKAERRRRVEYWITTGIALAALVRAFWPEIIWLVRQLAQ